jgi:DNA polymerase-3 subunit alpha
MRSEQRAPQAAFRVSLADWHACAGPIDFKSMVVPREAPVPKIVTPFVHLHAHSEYSPLDGLSKISEMIEAVTLDNQPAMGLTDHGVCAGHPQLQKLALKAGIKPIFGMEAYLVDDRTVRGPDKKDFTPPDGSSHEVIEEVKARYELAKSKARDYYHLILWAMDDEGLQNLWAMSTEAYREGGYYVPRLDWSTLERFNSGVMTSTACLRGPLAREILNGRHEVADANLGRLLNIFGDRTYIELGTCDLVEQHKVNQAMVEMAKTFSVPTIAVTDSHYPCYDDRDAHRVWIAAQTNKDVQDEAELFAGDTDYHMMAAREVRQYLHYLGDYVVAEAMANTVAVADRCHAQIRPMANPLPVFSKKGTREERIQADVERLVELCMSNWDRKLKGKTHTFEEYAERFEYEMGQLIDKKFCGYFLMVADYCRWAKDHNILVGPGRGSGGGCLVAYLCDIIEIDPVESELLFGRFLTPGRKSLPDFDVDFPTSKREVLTHYVLDRYGEDAVVRVGTHTHLGNKGVIRDLFRVLKTSIDIHWPDVDAIAKIVTEAESGEAGLGLSWEDLWVQHEEALDPYRQKYPLVFQFAEKMQGRLKSYGKHAAGVVISAEGPLTTRLPMRLADDQLVAQFDMDALEDLGLVKFDLLTLRTLDTIQMCLDLALERDGYVPNIYEWTADQYGDPMVWEEISNGNTIGIFQIETRAGTRLTKMFRPQSVADLADVITLVRPGPQRSGLTDTYFRRRAGQEEVTLPDPRLETVLKKTYGCIVYQEDVMQTCMVLGDYTEVEADQVRKILGKKKVEAVAAEGQRFLERVPARGMDGGAANTLWEQMAEFAKYSFNRAHAFGYAVLGFWTAWFKFMYPQQFLIAALSTVDEDRIPDFINEARRMGYKVLPPDVNESGESFKIGPASVRYGLKGIKGLGEAAVDAVMEGQPYTSFEDFMGRKGKAANSGIVQTMARVGCFDSLVPNRRGLERKLEAQFSGEFDRCVDRDDTARGPNDLPCVFEWASEEPKIGKSGRPLKLKPPPKKCTKACRHYRPVGETALGPNLPPYTDEKIRNIEKELLGVHLSSTPFDVIPPDALDECLAAEEIEVAPEGTYMVAAMITKVKPHRDRHGKDMGFIGMYAQTGELDVTVFKDEWKKYSGFLATNQLCAAYVSKNSRGLRLVDFVPL